MLEILVQLGIDPATFLTLLAACSAVICLAFLPFFISIVDPLIFFVISMCADAILVFGLNWDRSAKVEAAFFFFFVWLGFALWGRPPRKHPELLFMVADLFELEIILAFLCFFIVLANLYLGLTAGFPLLSAAPSTSKVTSFQGGLGFIRHINGGPYLFLVSGCLLMLSIGYKRVFAVTTLTVASLFIALSGSKGALLPVVLLQGMLVSHRGLPGGPQLTQRLKRYLLPSLLAASVVAVIVLYRDLGNIRMVAVGLARRILFYGDVVLYYYPRRHAIPELANVHAIDYLSYVLNSTLGMFRLVPYAPPLGTVIAQTAELGFGPNVQYFVRADIFFGPVWGSVYCFAVGSLIGFLRRTFLTYPAKTAVVFSFLLMLSVTAFDAATESQLFVSATLDVIFVLLPLWGIAKLLRTSTMGAQFRATSRVYR